jgi:hypothetical protein
MKITKSQLRRIIQEELTGVLQETYGKLQSLGNVNDEDTPQGSLGRKKARPVNAINIPHPGDPLPGEEPQFVGVGDTAAEAREDKLRQQRTAGEIPSKSHRSLGRRGFSNFQDLYARADELGLDTDKLLGKYGRDEKMGRLTRGLMRRVLQKEKQAAELADFRSSIDKGFDRALSSADQALAPDIHPANALYQQTMDMINPRDITNVDPDNQ